jgi:hypothetical protein
MLRSKETSFDVGPIDESYETVDVSGAVIFVLEVISVFPDVAGQDRNEAWDSEILVFFDTADDEAMGERIDPEESPTRAFDTRGSGLKDLQKLIRRTKDLIDGMRKRAIGERLRVRRHVGPEHGV